MKFAKRYPVTLDGRYFVVKGRLWRCSDPSLALDVRTAWVSELMAARRDMRRDSLPGGRATASLRVDIAKRALGERGPAWWVDGAPDYNRKLVKSTPYAAWFEGLTV